MFRDVRKNEDIRWSEEFHDSGYGYKEWGNMGVSGT